MRRLIKVTERAKDLRRGVVIDDTHVMISFEFDELRLWESSDDVVLIRGKENIEELHRLLGEAIENGKYAEFEGLRGTIV